MPHFAHSATTITDLDGTETHQLACFVRERAIYAPRIGSLSIHPACPQDLRDAILAAISGAIEPFEDRVRESEAVKAAKPFNPMSPIDPNDPILAACRAGRKLEPFKL